MLKMTIKARVILGVALFVVTLASLAAWTPADDGPSPDKESVARGAALYQYYCENCHGESAKGDGPTAAVLKVKPADLTRLSENNDGEFPSERVYRAIDGREPLAAHGRGQMPIWGLGFQEPNQDSNQEQQVRGRITQMIDYLKSIQLQD